MTTEEYEHMALVALENRKFKRKPAGAPAPVSKPKIVSKPKKGSSFSGYKVKWQPGDKKASVHTFTSSHYHAARMAARNAGFDDAAQRAAGQQAYADAKALWKSKHK